MNDPAVIEFPTHRAVPRAAVIGAGLSGRLLLWDSLEARFRDIRLRRDPGCALCGENATIHDLSAHAMEAMTPVCGVA